MSGLSYTRIITPVFYACACMHSSSQISVFIVQLNHRSYNLGYLHLLFVCVDARDFLRV